MTAGHPAPGTDEGTDHRRAVYPMYRHHAHHPYGRHPYKQHSYEQHPFALHPFAHHLSAR